MSLTETRGFFQREQHFALRTGIAICVENAREPETDLRLIGRIQREHRAIRADCAGFVAGGFTRLGNRAVWRGRERVHSGIKCGACENLGPVLCLLYTSPSPRDS